jgi:hypothetical protein
MKPVKRVRRIIAAAARRRRPDGQDAPVPHEKSTTEAARYFPYRTDGVPDGPTSSMTLEDNHHTGPQLMRGNRDSGGMVR